MRVTFQAATLEHKDLMLELVRSYYEFDEIAFDKEAISRGLSELLTQPSLGGAWLIELPGQTAGYFILTFGFDLEFGGRQATLTDIYIAPEHRRRGLGAEALRFVEDLLRQRGIMALELQVERHNAAALSFYERCGLEKHDRIPMSKKLERTSS